MRLRAAAGLPLGAAPQAAAPGIEVEGNDFRITLADGHVVAQDELPGVRIASGDGSGRRSGRASRELDAWHRNRSYSRGSETCRQTSVIGVSFQYRA